MRQEAQAGARSPGLCATAQILNVFEEPWNAIVGFNWFTDSTGFFFFKDYFSCAVENYWRESRAGVGDQSGSCYFSLGRK